MLSKTTQPHVFPWIALAISAGLLFGALGFQYIGGLAPCQMCYWQRTAHKFIILISLLIIIYFGVTKNEMALRPLLVLIILAASVSFGLAFWHVGVEHKWWDGPKSCMVDPNSPLPSSEDIMNAFKGEVKIPACSDVPWSLFGLSMAGYNAIVSFIITLMGLLALRKH